MAAALESALSRALEVAEAQADDDVLLGALADVRLAWETVGAADHAVALGVITHKARTGTDSAFRGLVLADSYTSPDGCPLCAVLQEDGLLSVLGKLHGTPEKRGWELLKSVISEAGQAARVAALQLVAFAQAAYFRSNETTTRASALDFIAFLLSTGDEALPASVAAQLDLPRLADKLKDRLTGLDARSPAGVRSGILAVLGAVCSRYNADPTLPGWLLGAALFVLQDVKSEGILQAAALEAAASALDATPLGSLRAEDAEWVLRHAIKRMGEVTTTNRYGSVEAALALLTKHSKGHLRPVLLRQVGPVVEALTKCLAKDIVVDRAKRAVEAVFDALSDLLCDEQAARVQDRRGAYIIARALVDSLVKEAEAPIGGAADAEAASKSKRRASAMALRAIGALAPAAVVMHEHPDQELAMVADALQRLSGVTGSTSADAAALAEQNVYRALSTGCARVLAVLDAYSRFWTALQRHSRRGGTVSTQQLSNDAIERTLVENAAWVVARFPVLGSSQKVDVCATLPRLLTALTAGEDALGAGHTARLLDTLTLRWLSSALETHTVTADTADMNTGTEVLVLGEPLWPRHVPLWSAMLAVQPGGRYLWDALCGHCVRLLSETLDLRIQRVKSAKGTAGDVDDEDTDLGEGWVATTPADVATAAHLCHLMAQLLPRAEPAACARWAVALALCVVDAARASPALPPLYALLAAVLTSPSCGQAVAGDESCAVVVRAFISECANRSREESGDVRDALLRLVLSAPAELVSMSVAAPAAGAALRLGVTTPSMAAVALSALERLQETAPDGLAPFLEADVIPGMAPLILEAARREARGLSIANEAAQAAAVVAAAQAPGAVGGRETAARAKRAAKRGVEAARATLATDEDVTSCATRCQVLLGRWAGAVHALVAASTASGEANHRDVPKGDMRVSLPLGSSAEATTELSLDELLPHITRLAQHSPDRVTKVAACELVHAIAVLLIGRQARAGGATRLRTGQDSANQPDQLGLGPVYRHLYPALLALAVDAEKVASQLFMPLTTQLARWLGHTAPLSAPDRSAFLEALFDGAADNVNGALREYCCGLVGVLMQWTVKDMPATSPGLVEAVEDVLRRCYAALAHPSPWTRCGGASSLARVAQNMVRSQQENGNAVSVPLPVAVRHAVQVVRRCCDSLARADGDPIGCGATGFTLIACRRFTRIAASQAHNSTVQSELAGLVDDMWRLTTTPSVAARAEAQRLVSELVPRVSQGLGIRQWLLSRDAGCMSHFGTPHVPAPSAGLESLARWCAQADACLQWAGWALGKDILSPGDLAALHAGPDMLSPCEAAHMVVSLLHHTSSTQRSPQAASAALRVILLLVADVSAPSDASGGAVTAVLTASDDSRARVCGLLTVSLFNPTALGVGLERPATALELTAAATQLVATCIAAAPPGAGWALGESFTQAFRRLLLAPTPDDAKVFPIGVSVCNVVQAYGRGNAVALTALMSGYDAISSTGCMAKLLPSPSDVALKLAAAAADLPADAPVGQVQLARRGLAVARKLNLSSRALLELLITDSSSAGLAFFERFKDQVIEVIQSDDVGAAVASLVTAIAAGSAPAQVIAEAVLDAARVSLALAPDAHEVPPQALPYGQLLGAVAANVGALRSLCFDSPNVSSKRTVLSLLGRVLDLDRLWHRTGTASVLDIESLVGLFAALLTPVGRPTAAGATSLHWRSTADASVATDALALLAPYFGGLAPEKQAPIVAAIAHLCSPTCVPLFGVAKLPTGHPDRASYLALRRALLQALVDSAQRGHGYAVQQLLAASMNVIVWDRSHQDVAAACDALGQAAWGKQQRGSGVADAIAAAAMLQLTEMHTRLDSPTAAVAMLLRPLLRAAPQAFIARFYAQHVADLLRLADVRSSAASFAPPATGEQASAISVAAPPAGDIATAKRMAVYALLQTLHECGAWPAALEPAQEAWHAGKSGQEKLTVAWTRRLTQELKTEGCAFPAVYTTDAIRTRAPMSDSEKRAVRLAQDARACRAAAFAALCALLAATQGADKLAGLVAKLLSGDWFLQKSWAAVVDCISPVYCRMDVVAVGPTREEKRSNLLSAAGVESQDSQSTLSRSLRVQATVDSSLSASLELSDAGPPPGGDAEMEDADKPAIVAEDLPDADTSATPPVDILDEGPVLDALVRLLEQCARVYAGEVQELAQQQMCAAPPMPLWLAPLLRALDGEQPLAPPNARLLMAKAVLRLHGRAHEAQEQRDLVKALKSRMQGATRDEWQAALADAGARSDVTLGASINLPLAMATLREDSALGGITDDLAARRAVPLIRRGRPHKSLPAQLAVVLGSRLVDVFVPASSSAIPAGGRALHDVLRQTCWFLLDVEMLWSNVAAGALGDTFGAALGRLLDYLVIVADAGQGGGQFTAANIDLVQIIARRAAANWTAVVASHPSRAHITELLRSEEEPKRHVALRLLTALMTPYEQWSQPLGFDVYQGDSMASAIVQLNVPQVKPGSKRSLGRKQLYTSAGLCLGLELARRQAAGQPEPPCLASLRERLRELGMGGDGIAPCVFTMASVAEHYPSIACLDDMRLCLTENLARTFGDVRWAALETLAVAGHNASPAQRALLFEAVQLRLEALTSAAADDGALERVVRLMRPLLLKPWQVDSDEGQRRATAARDVASAFLSALHRHRSAAVRLEHVTWLRDLVAAWPNMLKEEAVRQPLLAGVVDSFASVRDVCISLWDGVMPADAFSSRMHAMLSDAYTTEPLLASSWPTFATAMLLKLPARNAALMEEPLLGEAPLSTRAPLNEVAVDTRYRPTVGPSTLGLGGGMGTLLTGGLAPMTQQATLPQAMDSLGGGSTLADLVTSATQDIQPEWLRRMTAAGPSGGQGGAAASTAVRAEQDAAAGPGAGAHRPGAVRPPRRLLRAMTSFGDGGDASSGASSADRRIEQLRTAASQAGHDVRLLRRYRAGDYPDVRVSRNDYVRPLAALVLRDADTARIALTALSKCLWSEAGVNNKQAAVRLALARMLGNVTPDATLLAALHGVALADARHRDQPGGIPSLIDTSAVATLSLKARQVASGIILVENAVLYGNGGGSSGGAVAGQTTKRRRLSQGDEPGASPVDAMRAACAALAQLLGRGGDEVLALQVTTSQFAAPGSRVVDPTEAEDPSTRAMHAMLAGDDATAAAALEDAIAVHEEGGRESQDRVDTEDDDQVLAWQRDRLHILQRMGDWTVAAGEAHKLVTQSPRLDGTLDAAWASPSHRFAVDCLLRAAVRLPQERALVMGELGAELQRDTEFRKAHALELSQLDVLLQPKAPDAAASSLATAFRAAREAWAAAPVGAAALRHGLVAQWQASAELMEALPCMRALCTGTSADATDLAGALAAPWMRRWPSPLHAPGEAVELVVASRMACLDALQSLGAGAAQLDDMRRRLHCGAGDAARRCGALSLAQKYLGAADQAQRDGKAPFDFSVKASLIKILIAQADASGEDALRADSDLVEDLLLKPMRAVNKALSDKGPEMEANPEWLQTAHSLRSALFHRLSDVADESQVQQAADMAVQALGAAREAVAIASRGDAAHAAKSLLLLAQLLGEALTGYTAGDTCASAVIQAASGPDAAAQLFCTAVLSAAARGGSQLVRGALPRVISLLGQWAGAREAFKAHAAQAPIWLFLPWANQLLAALNGPEAAVLLPLLQALASAYPHALHFPVRIVANGDNAAAALAQDHLVPLVASAATAAFGRAVEDLTFPHVRHLAWLEIITPLAERCGGDESLRPQVLTLLRRMADDVASEQAARGRGAGFMNLRFAKAGERCLQQRLGGAPDFPAVTQARGGWEAAHRHLLHFHADMAPAVEESRMAAQPGTAAVRSVEALSMHLSRLRAVSDDPVELPGQYATAAGHCAPDPSRHRRVVGVDPVLRVMHSKQVPVVVKLRCDDGSEATFLAKGGEDVRLDARMQTLFRTCAASMAADRRAIARGLHIPTFHVEPLSTMAGLLSWLHGSQTLQEVLRGATPAGVDDQCYEQHARFVVKQSRSTESGNSGRPYAKLAVMPERQVPAATVVAHMASLHARLPATALRDVLLARAHSAEGFLASRRHYEATLVAGCAAVYVCGVGDRHLGNIMLDGTGSLTHIDFGYSFGSGLSLVTPELVPIRLTRSLTGACAPYDRTQLFAHDLGLAMGALHASAAPLCAAMEIFVNEPLDWSREAKRMGMAADSDTIVAHKLAVARDKLELANPVAVFVRELRLRYAKAPPEEWRALVELLRGRHSGADHMRDGICARGLPPGAASVEVQPHCLSAEEQAAILVDMARDPNLLGRAWVGWRPWL